jgi:hypothetical protein
MNETVRGKLQEILMQYGRALIEDADRMEGYLKDFCGEARGEIAALMAALREGVPEDLLRLPGDQPRQLLAAAMTRRLVDNQAMDQSAARWAVEAWAFALGINLATSPSRPAEPPKKVSPVDPAKPQAPPQPSASPGGAQQPPTESGGGYIWGSTPVSQPTAPQAEATSALREAAALFRNRPGLTLVGVSLAVVLAMVLWGKSKPPNDGGGADTPATTAPTPVHADSQRPSVDNPPQPTPGVGSSQPMVDRSPQRKVPQPSIAIGLPQVRYNVWLPGNPRAVLGMAIWLPGSLNDAQGRTVQLVTRFAFSDGRQLYANPNETRLRDRAGLLATFTPVSAVASSNIALADNALQMTIPYYALSLQYTTVTYQLLMTVTVYLDGQLAAESQPLPFTLNCGGPGAGVCF